MSLESAGWFLVRILQGTALYLAVIDLTAAIVHYLNTGTL